MSSLFSLVSLSLTALHLAPVGGYERHTLSSLLQVRVQVTSRGLFSASFELISAAAFAGDLLRKIGCSQNQTLYCVEITI